MKIQAHLVFLVIAGIILLAIGAWLLKKKPDVVVLVDTDDAKKSDEHVQGTLPDFLLMEQSTVKDASAPATYMTPEPLWY